MIDSFKGYLKSKGLKADESGEDIISFTQDELNYYFIYESSRYYLRLVLPNIYKVEQPVRSECLDIINKINEEFIVVKTFVYKDMVWCSAEQLVFSTENSYALFESLINVLRVVCNELRSRFDKIGKEDKKNGQ